MDRIAEFEKQKKDIEDIKTKAIKDGKYDESFDEMFKTFIESIDKQIQEYIHNGYREYCPICGKEL